MSSKMQLMGSSRVPWRYWMVQMMLSCLNMTSHSHLTIANWNASCLSPISDGSSKFIHRCSWQATPGIYDSSEWLLWQTLLFSCLNTRVHAVYPNRWWTLQMYWKMQLTGCSRAPWQLWMVQMTHLDVVMKSHSQLTIANLGAGCPSPLDGGSFNCL